MNNNNLNLNMTMNKPIMLTIKKTAEKFGLPEYMVRRMVKTGKLPCVYSGNRAYINTIKVTELLQCNAA